MKGTVLYGPRDVRFEERDSPRIEQPGVPTTRLNCESLLLRPFSACNSFISRTWSDSRPTYCFFHR